MALIVNGEHIDGAWIEREVESMRPQYEPQFAEMDPTAREAQLREWARENIVERTLLRQEARRQGISVGNKTIEARIAQLRADGEDSESLCHRLGCRSEGELKAEIAGALQAEKLVARIQKKAPTVNEETLQKAYRDNLSSFRTEERVSCAHIVKYINWQTTEEQALAAIHQAQKRLRQGVPFAVIAARDSDCPDNAGSLGYIARGRMVEEFDDIVFNLGPGEVSDVFRTRFGYHIATVYDRRLPEVQPFEAVRGEIARKLQEEMTSETVYAFIDELKAAATVEQAAESS